MNWITSFCSSNASPALALVAQDSLLKNFLRKSTFEVKTSRGHELNYVILKRSKNHPTAYLRKHNGEKERTLVLMHGFGTGLGYYDKIIAVDWLGMGCSSRTSTRVSRLNIFHKLYNYTTNELQEKNIATQVTDEFVDSLHELLRDQEQVEDFVLAGHSLGGYLCGKYTLKYPKSVKALILISPVGIPEQPTKEERATTSDIGWRIAFFKRLWYLNVTPQSLVRVVGSRGPEYVENFIGRRFSHRWKGDELKIISDYFYHITASPGNGEYCLSALLDPIFVKNYSRGSNQAPSDNKDNASNNSNNGNNANGTAGSEDKLNERRNGYRSGVFAKNPLEQELTQLKNIPILLIYGDNDWLYYPGAPNSIELWRKSGINAELAIIQNAGHHLYLENSEDFNKLLSDWTHNIKY